jgi:hypothetical protein
MWRGQLALGDTVRGPYAGFAEAVIHERDVAEVIAQALLDDSLLGRRIPITGPEALRLDELVPIIGAVIGRPLRFQEVPAEMAAQGMIRNGLDERFVRALMARYQRETQRPATVTDDVERILGRPARTFATWVTDHKGAWSRRGTHVSPASCSLDCSPVPHRGPRPGAVPATLRSTPRSGWSSSTPSTSSPSPPSCRR